MKKLLLILITLVLVFTLSGCISAPQVDQDTRIEALEQENQELQAQLDKLVAWKDSLYVAGFTYENDPNLQASLNMTMSYDIFMSLSDEEKDLVDKTKFPDYVWDETGSYISLDELGDMLTQKYLGIDSYSAYSTQYKIEVYKPDDMSNEEFMARLCAMLVELEAYDYYTYQRDELYLKLNSGASEHIKIQTNLMYEPKYGFFPVMLWNELFEVDVMGISYSISEASLLYEQYVTDGTFTGYVLPNYK